MDAPGFPIVYPIHHRFPNNTVLLPWGTLAYTQLRITPLLGDHQHDAGRGRDISLVPPDRAHTKTGGEVPLITAPLALGATENPGRRGSFGCPAGSPGNALQALYS